MKIIVETFWDLPHSYSLVAAFMTLRLHELGHTVYKLESPCPSNKWIQFKGQQGLDQQDTQILNDLPWWKKERCDALLQIAFPYEVSTAYNHVKKYFLFCTFEYARPDHISESLFLELLDPTTKITLVTPSKWSAMAIQPYRHVVAMHGAHDKYFHRIDPGSPQEREKQREKDCITFLSIGAMTGNKGIPILLDAFAKVRKQFPHARLIIKGLDILYPNTFVAPEGVEYMGDSLSLEQLNALYNRADVYVSPYMAEGFNLPVLEARACGLTTIVSMGGSTNDFTNPETTYYIKTDHVQTTDGRHVLVPDADHLADLMMHCARGNLKPVRPRHFEWDVSFMTKESAE